MAQGHVLNEVSGTGTRVKTELVMKGHVLNKVNYKGTRVNHNWH